MAYFHSYNDTFENQGRINPLGDDRYMLEDNRMTYCVQPREKSAFHVYRPNINGDSDTNGAVSSCASQLFKDVDSTIFHSPVPMPGVDDEADVPLLNSNENQQYPADPPSTLLDYCKEPMPTTNSLAWKKLVAATTMCLIFMVVELVGGYIAGSLAVMTDAAHLLSDCVGFLVGLFAVWVSGQPSNSRFTFGYHRAEVLGALLSISVIWILTGIFVYLAVERLVKSEFDIHPDAMMIVAAIGIFINIIMGCILHGSHGHFCGSGEAHSHSHMGTHNHEENINVKASVIHVLGDLIQSTGVFISALVIKFYPLAKVIDPICTFLCCILVMCSTIPILRQSAWILLECTPPHIDYFEVERALVSLDGVQEIHALHLWALTPGQYAVTVHIAVSSLVDRDEVLERAQNLLHNKFSLARITIQMERHLSDLMAQ